MFNPTSTTDRQNPARTTPGRPAAQFFAVLFLAFLSGVSVRAQNFTWIASAPDVYTNPAAWDGAGGTLPGQIPNGNIAYNALLTNGTINYLAGSPSDPPPFTWTNLIGGLSIGNVAGTTGTFTMNGGMLSLTNNSGNNFTLANGTFTLNDGMLFTCRNNNNGDYQDGFAIGNNNNPLGNPVLSINGGILTVLEGFEIGAGGNATVSVSGGIVIDNGWFGLGRGGPTAPPYTGQGTFNLSGGTVYLLRNTHTEGGTDGIEMAQNGTNAVVNISGGTLYVVRIGMGANTGTQTNNTETLNISGGNIYIGAQGIVSNTVAPSHESVNISGGTFHTVDMVPIVNGDIYGDTNKVLADGTNWTWAANPPANLTNSSFLVNGQSGPGYITFVPEATRTITLNNQWRGVGGLIVNGTGTVTMGAANTYTGSTVISQGTLALTGSGSIASANITIAGGAVLDATASTFRLGAGQILTNSSAGAVVNGLKIGAGTVSVPYDGSTPPLSVAGGTVTLSSNTVFNINNTGPALAGGSYKIISSTGGSVGGGVLPLVTVGGGGTTGGGPVVLYVHNGELNLAIGFYPPPEFTTQPASTNLVLYTAKNHLVLTTEASASIAEPLTYQWFTNGIADSTAGTSPTYTGVPATATNYYCVASNVGGMATSEVVSVTYVSPPAAPYPSTVLSASPIGFWRLNEPDDGLGDNNAGVLAHDYLSGNNGTYTNVNLGQPGYTANNTVNTDPTETAAQFGFVTLHDNDVYNIGVDFGAPAGTSATFSIEAWVYGYQQTVDAGIVSKGFGGGEQFDLDTGSDGGTPSHSYRFLVRDASGAVHSVNSSIQPGNTWHHLVGVCDEVNGSVTLYVDGAVVGKAAIAPGSGILTSARAMLIGSRPSSATSANDDQFVGLVNDVAVYNYALSATQVATQYFSAGIAPSFVQTPTQFTNANENGTLVVPALATGTSPLFYQWYNANNNQQLPGQTNATLVLSNLTTSENSFNLVVTNAYGSTNATVQVTVASGAPIVVSDLVPSSLTVYTGRGVTYSITAQGTTPFYYKWYQDGSIIANATNSTYTQVALSGSHTYSCTVSNTYNGGSITPSSTVTLIGGPSLPTTLYALTVLSNNPIAYWRLDEGPDNGTGNNGTIANDYAGGHNATYSNVILGVSGYNTSLDSDTAAEFGVSTTTNSYAGEIDESGNGVSGINFGTPAGNNAEFSVEAWVNGLAYTQNGNAGIVTKGYFNGEELDLDCGGPGNDLRFEVRGADGSVYNANSTINANSTGWHHLVGVCDEANGNVLLYVDGVLAGSAVISPLSGITNSVSVPLSIGARATSATSGLNNQFKGVIDEVAIYNSALSSNAVSAHYHAALLLPAMLSITNLGNHQLQLNWNTGTLQSATNAAGPYSNESGAASPYTVPATNAQMFYRVH